MSSWDHESPHRFERMQEYPNAAEQSPLISSTSSSAGRRYTLDSQILDIQDVPARPKRPWYKNIFSREEILSARNVPLNHDLRPYQAGAAGPFDPESYPQNVIRNQKYSAVSFVPVCLLVQFKSFINLFYLIVSISQLIPILKVGAWAASRHR